jgi:hypothetical protein
LPTKDLLLAGWNDRELVTVAALVHRQALFLLENAVDKLAGPVNADPVRVVLVAAAMRGRKDGDPKNVRPQDCSLFDQRQTIPPVDEIV